MYLESDVLYDDDDPVNTFFNNSSRILYITTLKRLKKKWERDPKWRHSNRRPNNRGETNQKRKDFFWLSVLQ